MAKDNFYDINAVGLKDYIETHDEKDYTLIDVRQPNEYQGSHIPGSRLISLPAFVSEKPALPETGDLIFICHSGRRSRTAALFALPQAKNEQKVFNLVGGIISWHGKTLPGNPRVQIFENPGDFDEVMLTAMDLEKGAWNFYKTIIEKFPDAPFKNAIEYLSLAEADHAEALYRIMQKREGSIAETGLPGFDDMFYSMKGAILEGGLSLEAAVKYLDAIETDQEANILELSLDIEYAAFDLYKNAAQMVDDPDIKKILAGIANGEKNHMKKLAEAFSFIK
jgi:rhodanese-related sulfurtransferase/rubrerythrin